LPGRKVGDHDDETPNERFRRVESLDAGEDRSGCVAAETDRELEQFLRLGHLLCGNHPGHAEIDIREIVDRANELLIQLEQKSMAEEKEKVRQIKKTAQFQLSIFESEKPEIKATIDLLKSIDINTLTPVDALWKLNELKKIMGEG
jgi:hypothetical protein